MDWYASTTGVSAQALVSTVHLCLLLLRRHRSAGQPGSWWLLFPGVVFTASPWLLPTTVAVTLVLAVHVAWFVACEKLAPAPVLASVPPPRPALAASRPAPRPPTPSPGPSPSPTAGGFTQVPVLAVFQETDDIKTFRFLRPEGFSFKAGQFLTVRVQADGRPLVRCYSVSSGPQATGYLEISVKRMGMVSGTLHATIRPGSLLSIRAPAGVFTYPDSDDRPVVLLAGGVGITPLMSMFRHALATEPTRPVTLIHSVRNQRQVTYRRELDWIAERHPQARVAVVVFEGPHDTGYLSGVINEQVIRDLVSDVTSPIYMICGPPPMMEAMRTLLASMGVAEGQVRWEVFEAAIALADQKPAAAPATQAPGLAASAGAGFQVVLRDSGLTLPVSPRQTLLEAVEAGGGSLAHSCRVGVCLTCRTRLVAGEVDCQSDGLDPADRSAGYVLPCVSWAKSDCELEA